MGWELHTIDDAGEAFKHYRWDMRRRAAEYIARGDSERVDSRDLLSLAEGFIELYDLVHDNVGIDRRLDDAERRADEAEERADKAEPLAEMVRELVRDALRSPLDSLVQATLTEAREVLAKHGAIKGK